MYETVAAVSSPAGKGGVALLRVSGAEAVAVAGRVFRPRSGKALGEMPPRYAVFGEIVTPRGEQIDTGIAIRYAAPASFTGEDVVEITCHGGVAVTRAVLAALFEAGAEPAPPGEFTRRAFLAGKMTLSEAEAVGLLIDADTESRRALASSAASGSITRALSPLAEKLTHVLSALYAAIDYPEEDVGDEGEREIGAVIASVSDALDGLLRTYRAGRAVAEGVRCAIVGVPNSGKSSLYNALLGTDDAIVTDIPGTTRDILRASADIGGATLLLADTAGIRDGADTVEQIGVERARREIEAAELVLLAIDASAPLTAAARELVREIGGRVPRAAVIAVENKSDLAPALTAEDREILHAVAGDAVAVSARTGAGMDALRAAALRAVTGGAVDIRHDAVIWDARQEGALRRARGALTEAAEGLACGAPLDAVASLAESALADIAGVDGRAVDEAIIDGIFARFCVGK